MRVWVVGAGLVARDSRQAPPCHPMRTRTQNLLCRADPLCNVEEGSLRAARDYFERQRQQEEQQQ